MRILGHINRWRCTKRSLNFGRLPQRDRLMILSSLVSRSSTSLLRYLTKLKRDPDAVLLFSVSAHAYNLEAIIARLRSSARHAIGCLSAPLPGASGAVICSTALFSSRECIPFRSELPGRAPIQVGRWNRRISSVTSNEMPDFTNNFSSWEKFTTSGEDPQLPLELRDRRCSCQAPLCSAIQVTQVASTIEK